MAHDSGRRARLRIGISELPFIDCRCVYIIRRVLGGIQDEEVVRVGDGSWCGDLDVGLGHVGFIECGRHLRPGGMPTLLRQFADLLRPASNLCAPCASGTRYAANVDPRGNATSATAACACTRSECRAGAGQAVANACECSRSRGAGHCPGTVATTPDRGTRPRRIGNRVEMKDDPATVELAESIEIAFCYSRFNRSASLRNSSDFMLKKG